jgi:hypothetical protein
MGGINSFNWYRLYNDSLPIVKLQENYYYEIINNWKEVRINIKNKNSDKIMHSSALYKFSIFLIQTTISFGPIIGDSITHPDARGLNLYSFALKKLVELHFKENSKSLNALVLLDNEIPNIKLPKIGFQKKKVIKYVKFYSLPIHLRLPF